MFDSCSEFFRSFDSRCFGTRAFQKAGPTETAGSGRILDPGADPGVQTTCQLDTLKPGYRGGPVRRRLREPMRLLGDVDAPPSPPAEPDQEQSRNRESEGVIQVSALKICIQRKPDIYG